MHDPQNEDDRSIVELAGVIVSDRPTSKAILFNDGTKTVWVPRSLLRRRIDNRDTCTIGVPEWFAKKEGLI